jgi:hypothetical protein
LENNSSYNVRDYFDLILKGRKMYWNFDKNFCDCILAAAKIFYERTKKCTIFLLYSSKAKITIKALAKIW